MTHISKADYIPVMYVIDETKLGKATIYVYINYLRIQRLKIVEDMKALEKQRLFIC
jgi:hypothetical protein